MHHNILQLYYTTSTKLFSFRFLFIELDFCPCMINYKII